MTLAGRVCLDDKTSWNEALALYREQFRFYLDYLIQCDCSEELLTEVEAEVKDRSIPDEFKFRYVLRMLMGKVVEHLRECPQIGKTRHSKSLDSPDVHRKLPAIDPASGSSLLLPGHGDEQVTLNACALKSDYLQGRQRTLAAELFKPGRISRIGGNRKCILPRCKSWIRIGSENFCGGLRRERR